MNVHYNTRRTKENESPAPLAEPRLQNFREIELHEDRAP